MKKITLMIASLFMLIASASAQGKETFEKSELTSDYEDGNFVGEDGITWTYVASRDKNDDANNSGIDGKAIMLPSLSRGSKITSSTISGGIGSFSVKTYKGFTGGGDRQIELFINGVSKGKSEPFDDYNEHTFTVESINLEGDFTIEIKNTTEKQVIIDDIAWTSIADAPAIANPTFSLKAGTFYEAQNVTLACATADAKIYYTTNGDEPTAESTEYTAAISVSETTTIKTIAIKGEDKSEVASATYTIETMPEVANVAAFLALEKDVVAKITGAVNISYVNYKSMYIQDASGWALVYGSAEFDAKYVAGKSLTGIVATVGEYSGAKQLTDVTLPEPAEGTAVEPTATTYAALEAPADLHRFVKIENIIIKEDATLVTNAATNVSALEGETEFTVRTNFRIFEMELKAGDTVNVVGFVNAYSNKVQIYPTEIEVVGKAIIPTPEYQILTMDSMDYQIIIDTVNARELNTHNYPETAEDYYGTSSYHKNFSASYIDSAEFKTYEEAIEEALSTILLPAKYATASVADTFEVNYKVYGGKANEEMMVFEYTSENKFVRLAVEVEVDLSKIDMIKADYQIIVDAVNDMDKNTHDYPETSEDYYGASSYHSNFDYRKINADKFTNGELAVIEAISTVLMPALRPDAAVADTFNVQYKVYDGEASSVLNKTFECTSISPLTFVCKDMPASLKDANALELSIYPNPASDAIYITEAADVVEVVNFAGATVLVAADVEANSSIDISSLSTGVYFVKATIDGQIAVSKLIKK